MSWWKPRDKSKDSAREATRLLKVRESQLALLQAATSTANAAEDVTSMLKARLDDSLRQIEITAQLLSDALIVCLPNGKIDSANSAAERIFGWKRGEVQGMDITALFRDEDGGMMTGEQVMHKFFFCHEGSLEDAHHMDCIRGLRRTGELFWVEVNINNVERADGTTIVILVCRDATNRIETQRELKLNELRFRSMFEASLDGIIVSYNHYVVSANPAIAKMLGYDSECMVANPISNFIAPEHVEVVRKIHSLRMQGDETARTYVVKMVTSSGKLIDVLVSSTSMQWGNNGLASLMMIKNLGDIS
jgi:PAS domain S-box-containing protein